MKYLSLLSIVLALVATPELASSQIVKTDVRIWPNGEKDSVIVYKEYTIDTIVGNDTVFFVQYWHKEWLFDSKGEIIDQCLKKEWTSGRVYNGLRNGLWEISDLRSSCFSCLSGSSFSCGAFATTSMLYYRGNNIQTFSNKLDEYFFLKDTLKFSNCPGNRNYIDYFYPDTINIIVTKDSFLVKINDIPLLKEETRFINEVWADIEQGFIFNRKYKILLDSIKNCK